MISVIVPTITGREDSLARTLASYRETLRGVESEFVIVKDQPNWPTACNHGYERSKGGIVHFINNTGAQTGCTASVTPRVTNFP